MARESVADSVRVSPEELVDVLIIENSQLRLELHAQKIFAKKLRDAIDELELLNELKDQ
jgi:hypothetical protein